MTGPETLDVAREAIWTLVVVSSPLMVMPPSVTSTAAVNTSCTNPGLPGKRSTVLAPTAPGRRQRAATQESAAVREALAMSRNGVREVVRSDSQTL